jgi:hypothetical protein
MAMTRSPTTSSSLLPNSATGSEAPLSAIESVSIFSTARSVSGSSPTSVAASSRLSASVTRKRLPLSVTCALVSTWPSLLMIVPLPVAWPLLSLPSQYETVTTRMLTSAGKTLSRASETISRMPSRTSRASLETGCAPDGLLELAGWNAAGARPHSAVMTPTTSPVSSECFKTILHGRPSDPAAVADIVTERGCPGAAGVVSPS